MKDQRDFSNIKILYRYEEWINRDSDVCVQFAKFEIILAFVEATMNLIFVGGFEICKLGLKRSNHQRRNLTTVADQAFCILS